jgi:hypothetical protein
MGAVNLAIVFGMGLAPELSSGFGVSPDLGIYQTMVKIWISHASTIFPEVDDDGDNDQDSCSVTRPESTDTPRSEGSTAHSRSNGSPGQSGVEPVSHRSGGGNEQRLELAAF